MLHGAKLDSSFNGRRSFTLAAVIASHLGDRLDNPHRVGPRTGKHQDVRIDVAKVSRWVCNSQHELDVAVERAVGIHRLAGDGVLISKTSETACDVVIDLLKDDAPGSVTILAAVIWQLTIAIRQLAFG